MECDGTFYRLDDVPIYFEPFLDSPFKFTQSNEDTLKQLFTKIKEIKNQVNIFPFTYGADPKTQNCFLRSQISSSQLSF
jgi:formylmethanofuran dehydrogenase subunit B